MEKYTSINFEAKVKPLHQINDEFSYVRVYVQGVGKNRNMTYMSKENIQKALPTLNYCPVVGHLIEYTDDQGVTHRYIGGHDWELTADWELKDLTVPYGVVVENSFDFEVVNEYGIDVEYLIADAILWTGRYPELKQAIYSDDIWFNQSMELNMTDGKWRPLEEDSNYTDILEWSYSALCLLGKADADSTNGHTDKKENTTPCFINAKVIPIEFSKDEFAELMAEMKEKLAFCMNQPSTEVPVTAEVEINDNNGGSAMTDENKDEVVAEVTEPAVEETAIVAPEVPVEENPETVIEEPVVEDPEAEPVVQETTATVVEQPSENFGALYAELKEKYDALEKEFSDYKAEHSFLNSDFAVLKEYKEGKEKEERQRAEEALFAEYEDEIGKTKEFKELKDKSADFSLTALKKECLCIVGMYSMTNKKTKPVTREPLKFSLEVDTNTVDDEVVYDGLFEKYLKR